VTNMPSYLVLVIGVLVFVGFLVLFLVLFSPMIDYSRRRRRLSQIDAYSLRPTELAADRGGDRSLAAAALAMSASVVRSGGLEQQIAGRLEQAGMRLRPNEWMLVRVFSCIIPAVLLGLLFNPFAGAPIGFLLGFIGPMVYRYNRVHRRIDAFASQLPDILQLIVGSLRSGFSLAQALEAVIQEAPEPSATEYSRALAESRLGVTIEDALDRVADRMQSRDLSWAVVGMRVQHDVGGNLAEVLTNIMFTMREREGLHREVRSLSAEGRLSAYILIALPFIMGALLTLLRPVYMAPLFTSSLGLLLLVLALVLMGAGSFWLTRIVKVEA
jgi:Flp pilus assembly protein TadB